jgi:hypothetical protein
VIEPIEGEGEELPRTEERLHRRIIGLGQAIKAVSDAVPLARARPGGGVAKGDTIRLHGDEEAEPLVLAPSAKPGGDTAKPAGAAQQATS